MEIETGNAGPIARGPAFAHDNNHFAHRRREFPHNSMSKSGFSPPDGHCASKFDNATPAAFFDSLPTAIRCAANSLFPERDSFFRSLPMQSTSAIGPGRRNAHQLEFPSARVPEMAFFPICGYIHSRFFFYSRPQLSLDPSSCWRYPSSGNTRFVSTLGHVSFKTIGFLNPPAPLSNRIRYKVFSRNPLHDVLEYFCHAPC